MKHSWLNAFYGLIAVVILFSGAGVILPLVFSAGNTINATGAPLASLFASDSVFPLVLMAGLLGGAVYLGITAMSHRGKK